MTIYVPVRLDPLALGPTGPGGPRPHGPGGPMAPGPLGPTGLEGPWPLGPWALGPQGTNWLRVEYRHKMGCWGAGGNHAKIGWGIGYGSMNDPPCVASFAGEHFMVIILRI